MEGGPRGQGKEGEYEEASAPPSSLPLFSSTSSSSRPPRPPRAPTPEPLPPLPTKLRILRGARGVNKTYWSLPEKKKKKREEKEGESSEEEAASSRLPPPPLVLFFGGDEVAAADSHRDVVRLQGPAAQAAACSSRYSSDVKEESEQSNAIPQVVVVDPSRREAGWACFDHFFSSPSTSGSGSQGGGLTRSGEPAPPGYTAAGLPALSQAASLLRDGGWPFSSAGGVGDGSTLDVEELKRMRAGIGVGETPSPLPSFSSSSASSSWPATNVVAFSKGGVVANQMLFELSALGHAGFRRGRRRRQRGGGGLSGEERRNVAAVEKLLLLPAAAPPGASKSNGTGCFSSSSSSPSALPPPPPHARNPPPQQQQQPPELLARSLAPLVAAFAASIDEVAFVDAGLNCRGAYGVTDPEVARGLALLDSSGEGEEEGGGEGEGDGAKVLSLRVELVGTPRQWGGDRSRAWLLEEKERMVRCLKGAGVSVSSELVLEGRKPDLRTHFLGIEAFGRRGGGGRGQE